MSVMITKSLVVCNPPRYSRTTWVQLVFPRHTVAQKEKITLCRAHLMLKRKSKCDCVGPVFQSSFLDGNAMCAMETEPQVKATSGKAPKEDLLREVHKTAKSTTLESMQLPLVFTSYLSVCSLRSSRDPALRLSLKVSGPGLLLPPCPPSPFFLT